MKVRASVKKRSSDCKIIRRKGKVYVINKKILDLNRGRIIMRIAGIDIPDNKRGEIALTYIYGLGRSSAVRILNDAGISLEKKVSDWTEEESNKIRNIISKEFKIEGDLKSEVRLNIKRLLDIGCYRGLRHRKGLPVRGQKTKNNSRTRKERERQ